MTNVKLLCEVDGKRYLFVEDTWEEFNKIGFCERRCAFHKVNRKIKICSEVFCNGRKCGHWEEIK